MGQELRASVVPRACDHIALRPVGAPSRSEQMLGGVKGVAWGCVSLLCDVPALRFCSCCCDPTVRFGRC